MNNSLSNHKKEVTKHCTGCVNYNVTIYDEQCCSEILLIPGRVITEKKLKDCIEYNLKTKQE